MSKYSVKKPLTIIVCVIVVIALGFVSLTRMTPDLLPSIDLPYMVVMTTYPGATPEEVQEEVTKPLEQSLATLENLKTIQSLSNANFSLVVLEFENGSSMDTAMVNTLQQVDLVEGGWSDTIGAPYIMKINPTMIPIMVAAVDMSGKDIHELSNFVNDTLMNQLEGTTGVASVQSGGLIQSKINILLDPDKINALNDKLIAKINEQMAEARGQINDGIAQVDSAMAQINYQQSQLNSAKQGMVSQIDSLVDGAYTAADNVAKEAQGVADQTAGVIDEISKAQSMEDIQKSLDELDAILNDLSQKA
jgi:HAE1 family hydrophobic/amphiphilic exporter-1